MSIQALDFEKPLIEMEKRIEELASLARDNSSVKPELEKLKKKADKLRKDIFTNMSSLQRTQLSRHPDRPYTLEYLELVFDEAGPEGWSRSWQVSAKSRLASTRSGGSITSRTRAWRRSCDRFDNRSRR